jgi:hypothetical protein
MVEILHFVQDDKKTSFASASSVNSLTGSLRKRGKAKEGLASGGQT